MRIKKASNGRTWEDMLPELRRLWADKSLTREEVANRLGVTPGAIIGAAWRAGLPPRGIAPNKATHVVRKSGSRQEPQNGGVAHPSPAPIPPPATLSSVPSPFLPPVEPAPSPRAAGMVVYRPSPLPRQPTPRVFSRLAACQYITHLGQWGIGTTFCEGATFEDKPYCKKHCDRCYIGPRWSRQSRDDIGIV